MVSWRDYEGVEGFGASNQEDIDNLNKALKAGQEINAPGSVTAGDGFAMRVESLERTMKNLTFRMEHVVLWKNINKLAAYNTIEEHNEISSYGENPDAGWIDEGDLPEEDDSKYARRYAIVKYLGTVRRVTHQMTLIKPAHGNIIAQETINGTMHLLRTMERGLFYGDSTLSALQFDGFEKQLRDRSPAANIIDLRGKPLSEDYLTDGALSIHDAPNYGTPTDLYCNPKVKADLVKTFFPKERYDLFSKQDDGMVGLNIRGFTSPAGDVRFQSDVFITDGGAPNAAAVGDSAKRPDAPTVSALSTPGDPLSQFAAEDAGDYFYRIVAVNRYGRSAPVHLVAGPTAVTVAAADKVTWAMTPGGSHTVSWYEVFRSKVGGAALSDRLILRVPNAAGAGAQTINDYNTNLPYCTSAFLFQQNMESMSFKQLAPMVKIPLATIDTSIRWAQLIYGVPVLYAPGKNVLYRNVGRAVNFIGQP
jgi:plastocyanin